MAKITRYTGNLPAFGSAATGTNRTVFGDITQSDSLDDNINADYQLGWEIVGPSEQPSLEDFNALGFTHGQLLAYLHQAGVAEWDSAQEYFSGAVTNRNGVLYTSQINANIGNDPILDTGTNWSRISPQVFDSLQDFVNNNTDNSINIVRIQSYYGGWTATVAGPKGGHYRHKTGGTNTSPTVGSPVAVSTIGTGTQAGYCWDARGNEWKISNNDYVTPTQFGAKTDGTDATSAFSDAANYAADNSIPLCFDGLFTVTKVLLELKSGFLWCGRGGLVGSATGSYDAILEFKNCSSFRMDGDISLNGANNSGYTVAFLHWTDGAQSAQFNVFSFSAIVNVQRAYQIGKASEADWPISENVIHTGLINNVAQGVLVYGTQAVLTITDFENTINASGWPSSTPYNVKAVGGTVFVNGGEMTHSVDTDGAVVQIETITGSAFGNQYGNVHLSGAVVETAAPLCTSSNAYASPTAGSFTASNCFGKHTQNLAAYIEMDSTFNGLVSVYNCRLTATSARTQPNIKTLSTDCKIYYDKQSFGENMVQGDDGISGSGVLYFDRKLILDVYDTTTNNGLIAGTVDIIYDSVNLAGDDLTYHSSGFTTGAGTYTVPAGGLKDVVITAHQKTSISGCTLNVELDGVIDRSQGITTSDSVSWVYPEIAAGTVINISITAPAPGVGTKTGGVQDRFQIWACRR